MKIPAWKITILGAVLCAALIICSRYFDDRGGPYFMASLAVADLAYLLAVGEFFKVATVSRRLLVFGLILAAVWHVAFLRIPSAANEDIHRYVWDGRLQRLGYNPYLVIPSDEAAKRLHTPETVGLNNPNLPSPYPAGAQLFFRIITSIHESAFALKVAFVLCDAGIIVVLIDLLRFKEQGEHLVLAYAWNPLLAIEVAGSGHIDIVGALFIVISAAALARGRRTIAAVAFAMAIAVKFLPLVLLPLYWKRIRIRDAALATAVFCALYLPFLHQGRIPIGSLGVYIRGWRFNGPVFAVFADILPPWSLAALAVLAGLAVAIWWRSTTPEWSLGAFAWPMAAALVCGPAVFPWYLLWLLPFLTSSSTLLLTFWTVSIIPTYVNWHLQTVHHTWGALPEWVMPIEYGSLALAAAVIALDRLRLLKRPLGR